MINMPEDEFEKAQKKLLDEPLLSLIEGGIVIDADLASRTPCTCVKTDDKEICWSPGIIGALSSGQRGPIDKPGPYCTSKEYKESPKIKERIEKSVKVCEGLPIKERLSCLSVEFRKRGIEL